MRKLGYFAIFLSMFLFAERASATTYYISYSSGSNSNSGTSQSTPWKTHPYMQARSTCTGSGSAPAYSHAAGDVFIFKQGDSWPNACFDMVILAGGATGNPDVYTFDPAWGTSSGTTNILGQPAGVYQFNAGGAVINGSDGFNRYIYNNSVSNVTFNGMEFTGMRETGTGSFGNDMGIDVQSSTNVIISNIWAHNWTHPGASSDSLLWIVGHDGSPFNAGVRVTGSIFDGANSGGAGKGDSGSATFKIPLSDFNIVRNMSNGLLTNENASIHDNLIGPINLSFDPSDHENCIEPITMAAGVTSVNYFYNNVFHDCSAVGILTQGAGPSNGAEVDYLWNNVAYVGSQSSPPIPFQFDSISTNMAASQIHAWNNTVVGGSADVCMRTINRGNGNFGVIDIRNNHCISDSGLISLGAGANTMTNSNNVVMSTATAAAQGYTSSETFAYSPTSASSGTVGAGISLSSLASGATATLASDTTYGGLRATKTRPASGAWDAGAYVFSGSATSGAPAPPTNVKVLTVQ
jgi:hypothetical protein